MEAQTVGSPAPPESPPETKTGTADSERHWIKAYARVALDDLKLTDAEGEVDDASWWDETMPPILLYYQQITVDGYWQLTVKEHRLMFEWLVKSGVVANGDKP
jgi:hypothetical protein